MPPLLVTAQTAKSTIQCAMVKPSDFRSFRCFSSRMVRRTERAEKLARIS